MKKSTIDAISIAIAAILEDLGGAAASAPAPAEPTGTEEAPTAPKPRRGRPPTEATSTPPAEPAEKPAVQGKTTEELKAIIAPAVEAGLGEDVKKIIAKHGGTKCADLPAANHVAFARDIEALTM